MAIKTQLLRNQTFTPTTGFRSVKEKNEGAQSLSEKVVERVEKAADQVSLLGKTDEHGQTVAQGWFTPDPGFLQRVARRSAYNSLDGAVGKWEKGYSSYQAVGFEATVGPNEKGERNLDLHLSRCTYEKPEYYGREDYALFKHKSLCLGDENGKRVYTIQDGNRTERVIENGNGTLTYQLAVHTWENTSDGK